MTATLIELAHSDLGAGDPTLLYLPGWCGGREVFAPTAELTAETRRSVSLDWRSHGESPGCDGDFGSAELVADALGLIDSLGLNRIVPVALSHAGWVALELRRMLGAERVPAVVLVDWMPLGAPPGFAAALADLQQTATWLDTRASLFGMWTSGVGDAAVHGYVDMMGTYGFSMWARAGREISRSFTAAPSPLAAFAALPEPCPTLHVYAQPRDDAFLAAQQEFAAAHDWFAVRRVDADSHFPCLEAPAQVADAIADFLRA